MKNNPIESSQSDGATLKKKRESWQLILYASFISQLITMIGFNSSIPFVPLFIQKDLGVTNVAEAGLWAGVMVTSSFLAMGAFAPIWGSLSDRHGRKSMVLRSILGGAVVVGLMAFTGNVWVMLLLRIFQGILTGSVSAYVTLIASVTPKEKTGYALGLMQTSVFVGASIGPLVGGVLADLTDYRFTFIITSLILVVAALIVVFFVHEEFTPVQVEKKVENLTFMERFKGAFFGREFVALVVILALVQFASTIIAPLLALFIKVLNGGGEQGASTLAGLELGITGVASAISAIVAGRLSDRFGHRRVLLVSSLAAALLYFPQAAVGNVWELLILRALMGLAFGGIVPAANALIADKVPEGKKGAAFGVVSGVTSLGSASGPILGSVIAAAFSTRIVFVLTAIILLAAYFWIKMALPLNAAQTSNELILDEKPATRQAKA